MSLGSQVKKKRSLRSIHRKTLRKLLGRKFFEKAATKAETTEATAAEVNTEVEALAAQQAEGEAGEATAALQVEGEAEDPGAGEVTAALQVEGEAEDPEAGEATAAQQEDPFKPGTRVRLTGESFLHKLKYGQSGTVQGLPNEFGKSLVLFDKALAPVLVPKQLLSLEPPGGFAKMKPLTGLVRVSQHVKQSILRDIGVSNPLNSEVTPWKEDELLSDQSLDIFASVVRLNLGSLENEKIVYVPCQLSRFLAEGALHKQFAADSLAVPVEIQSKRVRYFI